ncbi:MAG TPA: hypothetical protein VGO62_15875, partial [Myxococcota bacterium]
MIVVAAILALGLVSAPPPDAAREKQELRLVEILHTMNDKPPADKKAQDALMSEYQALLFSLAGVDPAKVKSMSPADQQKAQASVMAVQGEVLKRRDPALAAKMVHDLLLYGCKSKQIEAKVGLK